MKKLMLLAAGIAASLAFAGCASTGSTAATTTATAQQTAATALAKLQTTIVNGCMVVQPTLQSVAIFDPSIAAAATANGLFCAAASSVNATSVQSLIGTGIPAIEQAVTASTLIPAEQKPIVVAAIGVFQLTVTNALAVYTQAAAAAPTAAAPTATSAPVAASQ